MQNIFCCEEDFKTAMWTLAASRHTFKGVQVLTFELMGNHVHLILAGQREECIKAFELFAARLRQAFPKRQRAIDWSQFKMDILPIERSRAKANRILPRECTGHSKYSPPTEGKTLYMDITRWSIPKSD